MSKPVKNYMIRDYQGKLGEVEDALIVSTRGIDANTTNELRAKLAEKDIRLTVIRNNLAKHTFKDTNLEALVPALEGPSTLAYGAESVVDVARELLKFAEEIELLEVKAGCIEGELYAGKDGVKQLSKLPTRDEAIANLVGCILSPGRNIGGAAKGPASVLAACLKSIEEKLENGEEIKKAG
ncbi:MAG: 50S ribosomal protein L10 [Planctomycetota bacterium]